jgi:enterochelin esterase-like enzyme
MERIITNITDALRIEDKLVVGIEKVDVSDDRRKEQVVNAYDNILVNELTFSTLEYF